MKKLLFLVCAAVFVLLPAMAWAKLSANHNQTRLR